jgi:curved DNA-binding protein CbpA
MKGTLSEGVIPGLLRELYVGRRSGHLHFSRGAERRSVRFNKGSIVHGDTNVEEDRLGEMLVRQGILGEVDLQRATDIVRREKARLGEVLIDLGVLDNQQLAQALASHAREVLQKVFAWSDGEYSFEEEGPRTRTEEDVVVTLSTGEIILEAVRSVKDPDVVRYALGDIDRIVGLSTDPLLRFQKITLTPADGYLLSRVDGTLSAREVIQLAPFPAEEAQACLFGLLCTGVVEYLPLPPKPRHAPRPRAASAGNHPGTTATSSPPASRPIAPPSPTPASGHRPAASPAISGSATSPATSGRAARIDGRPMAPMPPSPAPATSGRAARIDGRPMAPMPPSPAPATSGRAARIDGRPMAPMAPMPLSPAPATKKDAEDRRREILEAHQELKSRNHFEVLGIAREATEAQVKEAYFRLAKRFHPDAHHDPSLGDLRDKLEAVFIRLGEAYEILRNPRTRSNYESLVAARAPHVAPTAPPSQPSAPAPPEPPPAVDSRMVFESIRKAEKLFENEEYWDAIQLFETTLQSAEGKLKQRARIGLARAYLKNPKWVKRAEDVLLTVVQEDSKNADAYFQLGEIYRNGGLKSRALSMYRKVVELKPDHEEALVQVASLAPQTTEAPAEGGSLLKKIFGKS